MSHNTYADQMLRLLREAGEAGVPNYKLVNISLQYNFTIWQLRHKYGYDIRKRKVSKGTYNYYLVSSAPPKPVIEEPKVAPKPPEQGTLLDVPPAVPERRFF